MGRQRKLEDLVRRVREHDMQRSRRSLLRHRMTNHSLVTHSSNEVSKIYTARDIVYPAVRSSACFNLKTDCSFQLNMGTSVLTKSYTAIPIFIKIDITNRHAFISSQMCTSITLHVQEKNTLNVSC